MSVCTNILFLRILSYVQTALQILRFAIPIVLIVKIAIDFYKNLFLNDPQKQIENRNNAIRRIVAAIIVFLTPTLINNFIYIVDDLTGTSNDYHGCLSNIENIDFYINLAKAEKLLKEQMEKEAGTAEYQKTKERLAALLKNNKINQVNPDGTVLGMKYRLSESDLKDIAKICQQEQGSAKGAAWEASLIANRFELFGSKYGDIHTYVLKCGWWAPANKGTYKNANLNPDVLNSVRQVLIEGQRMIPLYVDEHDWTGDISKIVTNGKTYTGEAIKNHNNFQKDKTVIYNRMGAVYTYFGHPRSDGASDPFGYTKAAKNKIDSISKVG